MEGWKHIQNFAGYETPFEKRRKVIDVKRNRAGQVIEYYIEGLGWAGKDEAIQLVKEKKIDAVVVKSKNGDYLRTPPDEKIVNNLTK